MNALFLNPPFLPKFSRSQRSPAVTRSGTLYYPMWLSYAAATTERSGHEIHLIDAPAAGIQANDISGIVPWSPQLIVLETSTPSLRNDLRVAELLSSQWPDSHITMVGPHVTALPDDALEFSCIDSVMRGEYDSTAPDLADSIDGGTSIENVNGLSWSSGNEIIHNADRAYINDLDTLPFVSRIYRRFLNPEDYFNPNALYPMVTIVSGRGCPYGCSFCVYPHTMTGLKPRLRSTTNVVDEIEEIIQSFPGIRSIFFEDDTLTSVKHHARELSSEMIRRGITISWTANARADVDAETLTIMSRANLRCLCVGFESASEAILSDMKKRLRPSDALRFMKDARAAGVLVHGCFMVGMPGETIETMNATLDWAIRLNPDTAQFYPLMVYPGSPAYDQLRQSGHLTTDDYSEWLSPEGYHTAITRTDSLSPGDLVRFCGKARRRFYLRPRYILRKLVQAWNDEGERIRILRAFNTFWRHIFS